MRTFFFRFILIFLALSAYFRLKQKNFNLCPSLKPFKDISYVLKVSSNVSELGLTLAIITVRQFPPMESLRSLVNLEFLYGMYLAPSARALMQFPRASSDLLMFDPSLNLAPLFPVTAP